MIQFLPQQEMDKESLQTLTQKTQQLKTEMKPPCLVITLVTENPTYILLGIKHKTMYKLTIPVLPQKLVEHFAHLFLSRHFGQDLRV